MKTICVLKGDGIGPEIITEAMKVLKTVGDFDFREALIGGAAIDVHGVPLPEETLAIAKSSDAILLGAVGDWKYDTFPPDIRPEKALLALRQELGLFANLRPIVVYDDLITASPLKDHLIKGCDIMIMRELSGDIYFGKPRSTEIINGVLTAYDTMIYSVPEIERIAKSAFEIAMKRNKKVCSVDKANVLDSSKLWRKTVNDVAKQYPKVELSHLYVDNAAMQLVLNPKQFDVILTGNLFGDILSDEAAVITGSIGLLPSASLSETMLGMYEPCHGSAPDIKGQNKANPLATILSAAMMLRYSLSMPNEADLIEKSVIAVLKEGYRTPDIIQEGCKLVGTQEMGSLVAKKTML